MKKQTLIVLGLLGLIALILTACGSTADPLDGTAWTLSTYGKAVPVPGSTITANFAGGEVQGSTGCNSYFGEYEIKGDRITFTDLAYTEMACMEPEGLMTQEQEFLSYFYDAARFEIDGSRLLIYRSDGEALTFVPQ
ncbi:MAG: META domain-containing protein [Anaerolineae bacterium]|nr:META domain-containing protein [Anaerolineae bacterium]